MKKLIALLAVACVSFTSCSETFDAEDPNGIKKKFDFSEVDTDNLREIREEEFDIDNVTIISGILDDCRWIGVFDSQSGSLQCQYTDADHPVSYFEYGEEHKYEVGEVLDAYFESGQLIFVMRYAEFKDSSVGRLDLVSVSGNDDVYRYIIDEKFSIKKDGNIDGIKLSSDVIWIILHEKFSWVLMYDINDKAIICSVFENGRNTPLYDTVHRKIEYDKNPNSPYNFLFSSTDKLHFWQIYIGQPQITIREFQCKHDGYIWADKDIEFFDHYYGDSSKAPRYSYEYKTRTDDHISAVITQTKYDGTITKKIVDIRLVDDELIVDIQE